MTLEKNEVRRKKQSKKERIKEEQNEGRKKEQAKKERRDPILSWVILETERKKERKRNKRNEKGKNMYFCVHFRGEICIFAWTLKERYVFLCGL